MKYVRPVVMLIDLGDNDIITSSAAVGCDTATNQYVDQYAANCGNKSHKDGCGNKAHRGEN